MKGYREENEWKYVYFPLRGKKLSSCCPVDFKASQRSGELLASWGTENLHLPQCPDPIFTVPPRPGPHHASPQHSRTWKTQILLRLVPHIQGLNTSHLSSVSPVSSLLYVHPCWLFWGQRWLSPTSCNSPSWSDWFVRAPGPGLWHYQCLPQIHLLEGISR